MTTTELRTPAAIDQDLADLTAELGQAYRLRTVSYDQIHTHAGDRRHYVGKKHLWNKKDGLVLIELFEALKNETIVAWNVENAKLSIEQLKNANRIIKEVSAKIDALNAEFNNRGGWSRFFVVTNANGHIHSTMNCQTCYPTTSFGWNPSLSGKTEEEAVAELGPILCSICFPSAPLAWRKDPAKLKAEVTLRNKKPKPGIFCKVQTRGNTEVFKTPRSAQIFAVDELMGKLYYGYSSFDDVAYQIVVDALAIEWKLSHEETKALLVEKAEARHKRESK